MNHLLNPNLSKTELAIVHALAAGCQSKEIADLIGRSKPTVEGYIRMLYAKLGARSRAQIVARAYELDVLSNPRTDAIVASGDVTTAWTPPARV